MHIHEHKHYIHVYTKEPVGGSPEVPALEGSLSGNFSEFSEFRCENQSVLLPSEFSLSLCLSLCFLLSYAVPGYPGARQSKLGPQATNESHGHTEVLT